MEGRYLTKSKFKQALECPTKLFYSGKKNEYADNSLADEFLIALAKGGHQVGELAKHYYPGGHEIKSLDYFESLEKTEELLKEEEVIIYEAAFMYQNLFVRVDILVKSGNLIKLIEVKSKSYRSVDEFYTIKGNINSKWRSYLYDVAFQKYVVTKSHPEFKVIGYLMLSNKNINASVDGLYQRFLINEEKSGRISIITKNTDKLGVPILTEENVDDAIDQIWHGKEHLGEQELDFFSYIHFLEAAYVNDEKIEVGVSKACRYCQYTLGKTIPHSLKSGFHECWASMTPLIKEQLNQPLVTEIWYGPTDKLTGDGCFLQKDIDPEVLGKVNDNFPKSGLQRAERQRIQVVKSKENDHSLFLLKEEIRYEMDQIEYPLHMIDFETTMVPVPFHIGTRPYEQHAFQFSHHTIAQNGTVRHATQWINDVPGRFPNFEFVRALRTALSNDGGSIFRYSHHENTVLQAIRVQLQASTTEDAEDLIAFIDSISHRSEGTGKKRVDFVGDRDMIDLCDWVIRFYYDPITKGSNSLKAILPSILYRSKFLQERYSQPIYGTEIPSLNYKGQTWINLVEGEIISPYKQLPKLWDKYDRDQVDRLINPTDELEDGGAAMTAYNYMQFSEMSDLERQATIDALLHYCELDTLAMVMLWEGLNDLTN